MSPRQRRPSAAQQHVEWLQLVDVSGPFLSLAVLSEAFPQGLDAVEPELAQRVEQAHAEWQANRELRNPDAAIEAAFVDFVLRDVLEYSDQLTVTGAEIDDAYVTTLPEHRVTLRPERAIRRPGEPPVLLVATYAPDVALDRALDDRGLHASPAERMRILLARTGVRSGLVTNGGEWILVHAPAERTATFVTWYANLLVEERLTLRAFRSLLGSRRLFGVDEPETLDGLFVRAQDDEREVTDQLGYQARRAVELLVSAFDRADRESGGSVTEGIRRLERNEEAPSTLYESIVAVAMRIIFLLAAEARALFPEDGPWAESYAVTPLRAELEAQADRHGIEVLERRFDAWPRLLATFRAVHGGIEHSGVRMPGYGGGLFDPNRYPFLAGHGGVMPRISNRAVLHVLDALQTLEVTVPGGRERRPLSFRALGIEQIGHVYEGLLDHTALRAEAPALGLTGTKKKEPELALAALEEAREKGDDDLVAFLKEQTGRSPSALRKGLAAEQPADRIARLRVSCGHDAELVERVLPFLGLLRDDVFDDPLVFREGDVFVTLSPYRRSTGTHYTPPNLTEPIVRYALEPLVYRGPAEGVERKKWELRQPSELLELKVCDIAMGSAAFLVAACRYLAARLVEAWEQHPEELHADAGDDAEERELTARRLVAERCLYGVDVNPLAVEIAKVSLWLTTLRRDRPFTFVDHALRCGDSLLGLTSLDQLEALTLDPGDPTTFFLLPARDAIRATLDEVREARERIEATDAIDLREIEAKATTLASAERKLDALKVVGDLVVGATLEEAAGNGKAATTVEAAVDEIRATLATPAGDRRDALLASVEARAGDALMAGRAPGAPDPPRPFHWVLEFPEVLGREVGGFDAIVGNPPFLGGKRIVTLFGDPYALFVRRHIGGTRRGAADLAAMFLLRAASLAPARILMVLTNSISEGATREVGLAHLLHTGWRITWADPDKEWPGEAGVMISPLAIARNWNGVATLRDAVVVGLSSYLRSGVERPDPRPLAENAAIASEGTKLIGEGFIVSEHTAAEFIRRDPRNGDCLRRYLTAKDLNSRPARDPSRWVIDFGDRDYDEAASYPDLMSHVEREVKPHRDRLTRQIHESRFWIHWDRRAAFFEQTRSLDTVLSSGRVSKYVLAEFGDPGWLFSDGLVVFALDSPTLLGALHSFAHELWVDAYKTTMGTTIHYSVSRCFLPFPRPVVSGHVDSVSEDFCSIRGQLAEGRRIGLTAVMNLVHDQDVIDPDVERLRLSMRTLNAAIADAYGWTDLELDHDFRETPLGLRYTISDAVKTEALDRLLELNHARYAEEVAQGLHAKPAKRVGPKKRRASAGQLEL